MKITLHLILSIMVAVALVAGIFSYFQVGSERARLTTDLEQRTWLVAEGLKEAMGGLVFRGQTNKLTALIKKISSSKKIQGLAVYDTTGIPIAASKELTDKLPERMSLAFEQFEVEAGKGMYEKIDSAEMYLYGVPLYGDDELRDGTLVIFSDASYVEAHLKEIWKRNFIRVLASALLISIITVLVVRWSIMGPIAKMADWIKHIGKGDGTTSSSMPIGDIFAPISKEISGMAKSLARARATAEEDARLKNKPQSEINWTAETLHEHVISKIGDKKFIVVSNREPFMHIRNGRTIGCVRPASGLITALEPILCATGGIWIAHGAGDADHDTSDSKGVIKVPPENPSYELRRVWLTSEEEEGYYYGYSNEGLWPLCHIAHTRPTFRSRDWAMYQEANQKFARTIEEEAGRNSYVFIQDYHFSILPRMIKNKRPSVKIGLFWHIPWPNPEAFGICPQKREILHGMLGADLIGFHTQFHCNNFLDTVDRTLECRIDWERFSVTRGGHTTLVKPYPISIDFANNSEASQAVDKDGLLKNYGINAKIIGIGVDRIDYTKGIIERFRAVERFFEKYPEYIGMFTFVELGAPSREHIKRYTAHISESTEEAERINWKFKSRYWKPIMFLKKHFSHEEISPFYKAADLCMVTSLHDGMNLVAKEFVASRSDDKGVLILSTFTGASRELRDALLVNPYDVEQMADMIKFALEMDEKEQVLRMRQMRDIVRDRNVFAWAGNIITDLSQIPSEYKTPQ